MSSSNYRNPDAVQNNVEQGKAALHRLKGLSKALNSLQNHAEFEISRIEEAFSSFKLFLHDGINSAPDDVLAMIFEAAVTASISGQQAGDSLFSQTALSVAAVNRRFRSLALQQPVLWSIVLYKHPLLTNLFLRRSGDIALTVFFGPSVPIWYTEAMKLLSHRWGQVIARTANGEFHLPENREEEEILVYPRLHTVQLEHSRNNPSTVYLTWTVPSLRRLSVQNVIPILPTDTLASLTSFSITTAGDVITGRVLLRHLRSMRNVRDLSLSFGSMEGKFGIVPSPRCTLGSVKWLRIELRHDIHYKDSYEDFDNFLDRIAITNVQRFEVDAVYDNKSVMKIWSKALFWSAAGDYTRSSSRLPSVEHMMIDIRPKNALTKELALPADDLFQYSKMKHLYIRAPGLRFIYPRLKKNCELQIRTVTIKSCKQGVCRFLHVLLSHINPNGTKVCDIIEKLTVIGCTEVTMNFLMKFLPEEKIEWSPVVDD